MYMYICSHNDSTLKKSILFISTVAPWSLPRLEEGPGLLLGLRPERRLRAHGLACDRRLLVARRHAPVNRALAAPYLPDSLAVFVFDFW